MIKVQARLESASIFLWQLSSSLYHFLALKIQENAQALLAQVGRLNFLFPRHVPTVLDTRVHSAALSILPSREGLLDALRAGSLSLNIRMLALPIAGDIGDVAMVTSLLEAVPPFPKELLLATLKSASLEGQLETIKLLCSKISLENEDKTLHQVLINAIRHKHLLIIDFLLTHYRLPESSLVIGFWCAAKLEEPRVLSELWKALGRPLTDEEHGKALWFATYHNRINTVAFLLMQRQPSQEESNLCMILAQKRGNARIGQLLRRTQEVITSEQQDSIPDVDLVSFFTEKGPLRT